MTKIHLYCVASLLMICSIASLAQKPNVLLIITDQHAGLITTQSDYPYVKTPGIDKIASYGVAFTRTYTPYPVCVAMRASLMTGIMPHKSVPALTEYTSIGDVAKKGGYTTAYFGKWHVGNSKIKKVADWHGFEEYDGTHQDTKVKNLTIDYLKKEHEEPFFMVTSFLNPHNCCELARSMAGMKQKINYTDGGVEENMNVDECPPLPANFAIPEGEAEGFYCRRFPDTTNMTQFGKHPVKYWDNDRWRQYMYGYDRLVEKVDAHVLDIMNVLEEEKLLENTMVIYTSDHGDGHASHMWNQKMTFYEESVNVPFVVAWKGQTRAGVIDKKTLINNTLDLYATLSNLFEVESDTDRYGIDLMPSVLKKSKEKAQKRTYVASEINQNTIKDGKKVTFVGRMIVSEDYKYILFDSGENREQFFDIKKDKGEMTNLINNTQYTKQINRHKDMLREWISESNDVFSSESIPSNSI